MTFVRILVAVDDSPAALEAARVAVELARAHDGRVRAVTVRRVSARTGGVGTDPANHARRLAAGGRSVLSWVAELAAEQGVAYESVEAEGEPFTRILAEAETWSADLIVMGRSDRRGPSSPYLGSETAHVLEFAERPVLVVPTVSL